MRTTLGCAVLADNLIPVEKRILREHPAHISRWIAAENICQYLISRGAFFTYRLIAIGALSER